MSEDNGDDGDVPCPHPDCESEPFGSERAMKIHHSRVHGESLIEMRECQRCGEEFRPRHDSDEGKFCSRECQSKSARKRVEKECQHCGEMFSAVASEAKGRKYCSKKCGYQSQTKRITKTCPCGITFETLESKDREACSWACRSELETDRPRPDDVDMLLWLLYVYEDNNMDQTHRRANICLEEDDRVSRSEVSDRLFELGVHRSQGVLLAQKAGEAESVDMPDGDDSYKKYQRGGADV